MRIAQIAPPFEAVPPTYYGGTERVVATLTEDLVRRGHDVTLFASADSRTSARLVPIAERALWHHQPPIEDFAPFWAIVLEAVTRELPGFDVVHSHIDFAGFPLARLATCPVVTTLHSRLDLPAIEPLYRRYLDVPLVSISNRQRQPVPDANWIATVHHGMDFDDCTFRPERGEYLAFLGRISAEKGLDVAIRVARQTGMPLKIAARQPMAATQYRGARDDCAYYEAVIQPMLKSADVEMIGPIGDTQKDDFLGGAAALLFPIHWPEPFGLVMIEALARGTPVLAFRHGSVPELIDHGRTGFVCDTEDDLVDSVQRIPEINRAYCRRAVEQRFSATAMAGAYESVYKRLVQAAGHGRVPAQARVLPLLAHDVSAELVVDASLGIATATRSQSEATAD